LNFTTFLGGTATFSSVRGFWARRARRDFTSNTPKSRNSEAVARGQLAHDLVQEHLDHVLGHDLGLARRLGDPVHEILLGARARQPQRRAGA